MNTTNPPSYCNLLEKRLNKHPSMSKDLKWLFIELANVLEERIKSGNYNSHEKIIFEGMTLNLQQERKVWEKQQQKHQKEQTIYDFRSGDFITIS